VAYTASTQQDLDNLSELFTKMAMKPDISGDFTSELQVASDGFHKFVVVRNKKNGQVVAYALLRQIGPDAELEQLYSHVRGAGYGNLALKTVETVAKHHGASQLYLHSVPEAAAFYRHLGYKTADNELFVKKL